MALGRQIGEFTLTERSTTVTPGSGGARTLQTNFQGQVSGEAGDGIALGTMTVEYEPNMKSGTWSYCGMTVLNSGGGNTVNGQGTWEQTSPNKLRCRGTAKNSDGSTSGVEFELDATTETVTISGKLYEWS